MTQIAQMERELDTLRAMLREAHMCLAERAAETMPKEHDQALRAEGFVRLYEAQEMHHGDTESTENAKRPGDL